MADTGIAAGKGWPTYLDETWVLSSIAIAIIFLRWIVRIRTVGFKGFQGDDYVTIGTLTFVIMDAATVTVAFQKGQNVDLTADMIEKLTPADIARITWGSKVELSAWYSYVTLIWCLKFTLLFFYQRLTLGTFNAKLVKYLFWVMGLTFLALLCIITFGCWPFAANWQVTPMAPWKCSFRPQNLIGTAVLNTVTDALLLIIPVILLYQLKISLKKKLVIGIILSSGIFVIIAAIIRAVLSLSPSATAKDINSWGVRETIIGVFTVNVPILRPLFKRAFWVWGPYAPGASKGSKGTSGNATQATDKKGKSRNGPSIMASAVGGWGEDIEMAKGEVGTILKESKVVQTFVRADEDEDELLADGESRSGKSK
ncbi:hypothetical protein CAC42_5559 [Sphaceloma murrayae]|uniref:Rhodopsin domain-containing protein n=1 Tax=Sphaceloma murrayae TaxID=2082308 RepID=A0A2K1QYL6_9PEZI|nr:hypothetical protein CAC42_5559 [Sphaceloma murrayae]